MKSTGIYAAAALIFALSSQTTALAQAPQCTTVADCAQKAMEAAYQAKVALEIAVPKGAVMAFNLAECPNGWSPLVAASGRVIVGAGKAEGLSERKLAEEGGEEKHVLTVDEMPSHNHTNGVYQYLLTANGQWTARIGDDSPNEPNLAHMAPLAASGGSQAHNNMQPFHVLTYCERK
jgi:hypothetical protein